MDISVALDGAKRRDIKLYEGDTDTLNVTVYLRDGDPTSVVMPTDLKISTIGPFEGAIPVGTSFTVPKGLCWRNWFTLTGVVAGARLTLAYGYVLGYGEPATPYPWGNDYGWRWPYGGNAWGYI